MAQNGVHGAPVGTYAPAVAWLAGGLTALLCFGLVFVNGPGGLWFGFSGAFLAFGAGLASAAKTRSIGVGVIVGAVLGVVVAIAYIVAAMSTIYS